MNWLLYIICMFLIIVICVAVLYFDKGRFFRLSELFISRVKIYGLPKAVKKAVLISIYKFRNKFAICRDGFNDDIAHIAFAPTGGFGDYIISAKILEELLDIDKCEIDVYVEKINFGKAVYANRNHVNVLDYNDFEKNRNKYDLALLVEHFVHVKNLNAKRLKKLAPNIYSSAMYIKNNWDSLYINIDEQAYRERIRFDICRQKGLDRWTQLRMDEAFPVKEKSVYIPLLENAHDEWIKDDKSKEKYITVNFGTDVIQIGKTQLKMWPKASFESAIKNIKSKHPNIKIYQLGAIDAEKLKGCDEYILGQNIELVKWIIKGSICHVDCEGGLVHLATMLGTKCVVMFNVTPMHMYAYSQNINIKGDECDYCMGLSRDWAYKCIKGYDKCHSIASVEKVSAAVTDILKNAG